MTAAGDSRFALPTPGRTTVDRPRLSRLLRSTWERQPLTVLWAPAGYGKTTAVAHWLDRDRVPHAWLSVTPRENDPTHLASRLLAAVRDALPREAELDAGGAQGSADVVIAAIADAVERCGTQERFAVVLDDYQVITDPDCHRLVSTLVDALSPTAGVVVCGRTPPPLRLARRRLEGTLTEIAGPQLRFAPEESELLLNRVLHLAVGEDELERLDAYLHGWPAGLAFVAVELARPEHEGFDEAIERSRATVAAYVREEVLESTTPQLADFLCRTAVLGRFSAPLCEVVLDDPAATELFDEARHANLFLTSLDPEQVWQRYLPAVGDALAGELARHRPELISPLHRRASAWLEQAGMIEDAIEHALLAEDGPHAARLLAEHWLTMVTEQREAARAILDRLPAERGAYGPFCEALELLCLLYEGVDQRVTGRRAEALAADHGDAPGVRLVVDTLLISPLNGDIGRAIEVGREAWLRHAEEPEVQAHLAGSYAAVLLFAGDADAARAVLEPRLPLQEPPTQRLWTLGVMAIIAAYDGDHDLAEHYGREARAIAEAIGRTTNIELLGVTLALAEAARLRGDLGEARRRAALALEIEARRPGSVSQAAALTLDARIAMAEGDSERARTNLRQARAIVDRFPDVGVLEGKLAAVESASGGADPALLGSEPTRAEQRVLELLDGERTLAQIARELHVTRNTVKSHVQRLYHRLGAHNRAEAVAAARHRGLL